MKDLTSIQDENDNTADIAWYCLRCQTKKEHLAGAHIRSRVGIEVFAPRITFTKNTRKGKARFTEALFPGYLFAACTIDLHLRHLLSIPGVIGIVRYGNHVPPVPGEFIDELRSRIPNETFDSPDPIIEVGAAVTITEGPFKDLQAVVSEVLPARDRIRILLEFLGRQTEVEVSPDTVFPDEATPKRGF
ncbi:MAG: transcription termination/antitermination NusG family protein [Verrucomicrobiota bacterium]